MPNVYLIPVVLNYGEVLLQNRNNNRSSINNIQAPTGFNWATIYQISWYGIPGYVGVGNSVLYNGRDVICQLAYSGRVYPIIEAARLVTVTEIIIPS